MKIFTKIFAIIISIFILLLPILIFIFHMFFSIQYIQLVNDSNKKEIVNCLKEDGILLSNENLEKIELENKHIGRHSIVLKLKYSNNDIDERIFEDENYKIIKYLDNNTINIDKLITNINWVVLILVIAFVMYCFKIPKDNVKIL